MGVLWVKNWGRKKGVERWFEGSFMDEISRPNITSHHVTRESIERMVWDMSCSWLVHCAAHLPASHLEWLVMETGSEKLEMGWVVQVGASPSQSTTSAPGQKQEPKIWFAEVTSSRTNNTSATAQERIEILDHQRPTLVTPASVGRSHRFTSTSTKPSQMELWSEKKSMIVTETICESVLNQTEVVERDHSIWSSVRWG